jgi:hypothetical protein
MLRSDEVQTLKNNFQEIYRQYTPMDLLTALSEVQTYLHKEDPIIRRLAFNNDNWRFREMLKLRREIIQSEIRRR